MKHSPRRLHFLPLLQNFDHPPLKPLNMSEPLEPVAGVGVEVWVIDAPDVDDGGEVAVQSHLSDVAREVLIRDDPRGGEVAQLIFQLRLAHNTDLVILKVQRLN